MQKKGQAAMEFLMTYGWAILAAVVAIGVLAYFGVFSPGRYLPEICTITSPLGCEEQAISTSGIRLIIRNGAGSPITIHNLTVFGCGENLAIADLADGATTDQTLSCTLVSGAKFRGDIAIIYQKSGATLNKTSSGSISGEVV